MRQSLPLMHFYSGKLLQFYSGVDNWPCHSYVAQHAARKRHAHGVNKRYKSWVASEGMEIAK
jgi:hypothetical protein